MSFRSFFPIKRNLYQRLFSQDVENRHSIDEIIVHPAQRTYDSSTSSNSNFHKIENLIDFFETPYSKSLLKDTRKISIQKFETLRKPSATELEELSQKCLENSIVILLAIEGRTKFHLYWKSKKIRHFLALEIYEKADFLNDINLFEFLAEFLANSMMRGHLGLHSEVLIKPTLKIIEFHWLADHRNYNLLLIAADAGDAHVVKLMLELGFTSDFREISAQTLAWKNRHFEVLSLLLKSNLIYPHLIHIDECPEDIQKFYEVSCELNEAILARDGDKVLRIITQNKDINHFYNLNNESALAFALNRRLFDMYRLLISKNIMFGPHENFSEIKEDMKESEREKLREIHFKESKTLPDNHMHVLMSNSRLGHDSINVREKFQKIQNAFEILNGNPFIQILLKIVAASRNFRIIFDFNRDSVEVLDPTVDDSTDGLFYLSGRIYIAAKKLLYNDTKFEALGTIAHEICHYTMALVYTNYAKPYFVNDSKTKKLFNEISKFCQKNKEKEELIDVIYKCYQEFMFHAELIVRVPHLIMVYLNNPEKFNSVRSTFHGLFDVFENKILKEMKEALPKIEAKAEAEKEKNLRKIKKMKIRFSITIVLCLLGAGTGIYLTRLKFYKPTYKFSTLSPVDQIKVENAPVIYKHVDIVFHDLFPHKSYVYDLLTSDDISQMLDKNPLDFSNPHLYYLNDLVVFEWKNLTTKLKDKFLSSNFTFQNETVIFKNMSLSTSDAFDSFQSKEIISVLDGKLISVHKMISNNSAFYTERSMFTEYIYPIYYLFMNKLNQDKTQFECVYKNTTGTASDKFETFYKNFTNMKFEEIVNRTNDIAQLDDYVKCLSLDFRILDPKTGKIVDSLLNHTIFQKGFDEVLIESGLKSNSNSSKIFILSADAGAGKTVTFRQFALRIKRMYPTRWVSYIDYRQKSFIADKIATLDNARTALEKILEVNQTNMFEKKLFKECFDSGQMILLWDGYDQINWNTSWNPSISKILKLLYSQNETKYIQFVSTKPFFSDNLRKNFSVEPFTFVPLDEASRNNFLYGLFSSHNMKESQIIKHIKKVYRIISSTKSKYEFNTPMPLQMIANVILTSDNQTSENLYQLYQRIVKNKLHAWLNNVNGDRKLIESILVDQISALDIYQRFAFRMIPNNRIGTYYRFLALNLFISKKRLANNINVYEISEMGILQINSKTIYSFAHPTFMEFFIAQYVVLNVLKSKDDMMNHEAELRIQLFYWSIQDSGISIFIDSYLQSMDTESHSGIDQIFENLFSTQYQNFTIKILQNCPTLVPFLIRLFKRDHQVLTQQLQITQSDGLYPATYDFAHFNVFSQDQINRLNIKNAAEAILTTDEYEKFISLKDHKGIILFSMYCIKQYYNSTEYARKFIPEYDLSDEIFNNSNASEVFELIAKNLTLDERKKLLTSETVWHIESIFNKRDESVIHSTKNELTFYKILWNLVGKNLTQDEQKIWITKIFKFIFLLEDETTRDFLITKVQKLYLELEIVALLSNSNILHLTASLVNSLTSFKRFNSTWNFFVVNTNKDRNQQKQMLKELKNVECYLDQKLKSLCYLVPKINLLQSSLLRGFNNAHNSSMFFQDMLKLYYDNGFNNTELQELIITSSKEFVPFLIMAGSSEICKTYADFLKGLFKDNKSELVDFLTKSERKSKFSGYALIQMNHFSPENFKIFKNIVS